MSTSLRAGDDHALQFDVAGGGRRRLDSDQKIGGLKAFGLHVQNIFSGRQVADGVGAGRTGRGVGGLVRLFLLVMVRSAPLTEAPRGPVIGSGDIAGGGLLGKGQRRKNEKNRDRSGPQT